MSVVPRFQPGWRALDGSVLNQAFDLVSGVNLYGRISTASVIASNAWHGQLVIFTQACAVTIPFGLRRDFSFGWTQEGGGTVSFAQGAGAILQSLNGLVGSAGQFADGGVYSVPVTGQTLASVYRLYGALA